MMRALAVLFVLTGAPAALAQEFPAAYRVTGVATNDVLNIRAEPSASAAILGVIAPQASGVEVLRLSDDGKWGFVPTAEGGGWVAMRFLQPMLSGDPARLPRPFTCVGTEPFWSFDMRRGHGGEWSTPDTGSTPIAIPLEKVAPTGYLAIAEDGRGQSFHLTVSREWCSDGMSDREFGFVARLFIEGPGGNTLLSGCCTLDHR